MSCARELLPVETASLASLIMEAAAASWFCFCTVSGADFSSFLNHLTGLALDKSMARAADAAARARLTVTTAVRRKTLNFMARKLKEPVRGVNNNPVRRKGDGRATEMPSFQWEPRWR